MPLNLSAAMNEIDPDRIDEAVLALLFLGRHDGVRTWKSFDWAATECLHANGLISDPAVDGCAGPGGNCSKRRAGVAAIYSITSSAIASSLSGILRPSDFAVLRLTASSYLLGFCTGSV